MQRQSVQSLNAYLNEHSIDVVKLSLGEFRIWIQDLVDRAARQELFRARCLARDLERRHRRRISDRITRLNAAKEGWLKSASFGPLNRTRRELDSVTKGIEGLESAVRQGRADPAKLESFRSRRQTLIVEEERMSKKATEWRRFQRADRSLANLLDETGLTSARETVQQLASARGNAAQQSGDAFEDRSAEAVTRLILPEFTSPTRKVVALHGVTLQCARGEFDHLIVAFDEPDKPASVLGVVEAKRNPNDIPHGFRVRQENLAWFADDLKGFDPQLYRTSLFTDGRFNQSVEESVDGERYRFDPSSFSAFASPDCESYRVRGLYFVSELRGLDGVTSAEKSKLLFFLASDRNVKLDDEYQLPKSDHTLRRIRNRILAQIDPMQTRDVLELYSRDEATASQIILI